MGPEDRDRQASAAAEGCSWGGEGAAGGGRPRRNQTAALKMTEEGESQAPQSPSPPRDLTRELQGYSNRATVTGAPWKRSHGKEINSS